MASKMRSNLKKKRKKTNMPSKTGKTDEKFSLRDVLELGGDESDYELLKDVDVEKDMEIGEPANDDQKDLNRAEVKLKELIKEIGLETVQNQLDVVGSHGKNAEPKKKKPIPHKNKEPKTVSENSFQKTANFPGKGSNDVLNVKMNDKILVHPAGRWFEETLTDSEPNKNKQLFETDFVEKTKQVAESLWENEVAVYAKAKQKSKSSDMDWLKTVATSGTLGDKIASLAIQIQDSPVHHLKTLDILLGMASKKGRRECLMAIDTLKDLWLINLLPDDRKLRRFAEFPLSSVPKKTNQSGRDAWNKKLIMWYFEDQLKTRFETFVVGMERLLLDNLENIRSKMLGIVFELLCKKPEQEKTLLLYLVNKVGDPNRKIASKAAHLLGCLVQKHPNMKLVITQEAERLLYRPNIGVKAQYYAICFLNQLILTKKDCSLASSLITIYFSLFKAFVDKGQVETKMLSALLSGVNRAFHYVKEDEDRFSEQVNMLFRVVHIAPFNTSVQALMLLFQVMDSRQAISDRYYQALYAKLLDSQVKLSSKQAMFLNIIYKSLKVDLSLRRVKAFVKRLLQVCSTQQPSFICGVLYLLSEVAKVKPGIRSLVTQPEELDEDEHFSDPVDTTENEDDATSRIQTDVTKETGRGHSTPTPHGHVFVKDSSRAQGYRANARNPLYCGAENACLWEVMKLTNHYHPSVSRFAESLLQREDIVYNGDPLLDFTLMRFLDRFVYKNPKKKAQEHGGSIMQPKSVSQRQFEQPVNTTAFLNKREENVREDEIFFHRYFKRKAEQEETKIKKQTKDEDKDDNDSEEGSDLETFGDEDVAMDFAREFEKSQKNKPSKKKKHDSDEDSEEDLSDQKDFSYDDMDISEDDMDDSSDEQKRDYSDHDYEKALLDNMSSDEFSEEERDSSTTKKQTKSARSSDQTSMFAAAEEFAYLLENSHVTLSGGAEDVDMKGASLKQQEWELSRMNGKFPHGGKYKGKRNRGKVTGGFGKKWGNQNNNRTGKRKAWRKTHLKRK